MGIISGFDENLKKVGSSHSTSIQFSYWPRLSLTPLTILIFFLPHRNRVTKLEVMSLWQKRKDGEWRGNRQSRFADICGRGTECKGGQVVADLGGREFLWEQDLPCTCSSAREFCVSLYAHFCLISNLFRSCLFQF